MHILQTNQKSAGEFLNGQLWADFKRCLMARRPEPADVKDEPHVAAAKGHKIAGYELAISELEKLPFEFEEAGSDPFQRPAVSITED